METPFITKKSLSASYESLEMIWKTLGGYISRGIEKTSKREVILKIEYEHAKPESLFFEAVFYKMLWENASAENYIPRFYGYFSDTEAPIYYMETDLLGNTLEEVFKMCNNKFSLKTILILGEQMISILDFIHSQGIVHRDFKPANLVFGRKEKKNRLFLIDFEISENLIKDGKHIPYDDFDDFIGSLYYASVNAHYGVLPTRRDDLSGLAYIFLKLLKGKLPWEDEKEYMKVSEMKRYTTSAKLFEGFPEEFAILYDYAYNMWFEVKPDYDYVRKLFGDLYKKMGFDNEPKGEFEWNSIIKE